MSKKSKKYKTSETSKNNEVKEISETYNQPFDWREMYRQVWETLNEIGKKHKEFEDQFEKEKREREAQLEKERREREAQLEKERKEREAQLEKERKEREAQREKERKEWEERMKRHDEQMQKLEKMFGLHWGRLVEALLAPGARKVFQERGINIHYRGSNIEATIGGDKMEIDVLLENEKDVVIVEIKTTARVSDIKDTLKNMERVRKFFPRFEGKNIYGAVAALKYYAGSDKFAESKGLFVIEPSGEDTVIIKNDKNFKPKKW
ncbi:MAG: hypothetical protein KatS3mg027_1719 [Bacteroidia bacterium]|nr:MAG: hypothetical protein KatS3mg027_1719 [Bacteroidia bacterium]